MSPRSLSLMPLWLVSLLLAPLSLGWAETREFKNKEGKVLVADMLVATKTHATLKMTNGQTYEVPVTTLSDADKEWVAEWVSTAEPLDDKSLDTVPRDFLDAQGRRVKAVLHHILNGDDLEDYAVLTMPDQTQRAFKVKTMATADRDYVRSRQAQVASKVLKDLKGNKETAEVGSLLEGVLKAAAEEAAKKKGKK